MDLSTPLSDVGAAEAAGSGTIVPPRDVWARRRARALAMAGEMPHAREVLLTYADLLETQARVAKRVPVRRWRALVSAGAVAPPRLRMDRLPLDEMVPLFAEFLGDAAELGTEVMRAGAGQLSGAPDTDQLDLIGGVLGGEAREEAAPFHVRAFLQPIATTLAAAERGGADVSRGSLCFVCGGAPVVGSLRDLPEALGSRCLTCGVCGCEWRLPRLTCAHCGEDDASKLTVHAAESLPWIRVDECGTCGRYLKTIDLRRRGDAVPLVDDLATLELDLWARERGLTRVQDNLFGL